MHAAFSHTSIPCTRLPARSLARSPIVSGSVVNAKPVMAVGGPLLSCILPSISVAVNLALGGAFHRPATTHYS